MSKVNNQFGKVNPEAELQAMAEKLSKDLKRIVNPREALSCYRVLKQMQMQFDYSMSYPDECDADTMVLHMEILRGYFFDLIQYQHALDLHSNRENEVIIEFKPNGK